MKRRSLTRIAIVSASLSAVSLCAHADHDGPHARRTVDENFHSDPARAHGDEARFQIRGPAAPFSYDRDSERRFDGDVEGSLAVTTDSAAPTSRYYTGFEDAYTQSDDFVFGAALTIRASGFHADPGGASEMAFGLFNSSTTGDSRTGDVTNPPSNSFDTVELAYFPNKSTLFGGPFLCPTVLGDAIGPDAFDNIAFNCVEFELVPGVSYFVEVSHSAAKKTLTAKVYPLGKNDPALLPAATVTTDLSTVSGFRVDRFGVSAYRDGYDSFAPTGKSLHAVTDYDLLIAGPSEEDERVEAALRHVEIPGVH